MPAPPDSLSSEWLCRIPGQAESPSPISGTPAACGSGWATCPPFRVFPPWAAWLHALGGLAIWSGVAFAFPPEFEFHDAEVTARGNAGVASQTGPAAVYYNPAALTGLPESAYTLNLYGLYLDYEARTPAVTGAIPRPAATFDLDTEFLYSGSLFVGSPLGKGPFTGGFGLYAPFGQQTDWGDPNPNRAFATDNRLIHAAGTFSLGREARENFSLGFSVSPAYAQADLNRGFLFAGVQLSFEGDGWGWGVGMGFQWSPWKGHTFGAHYRHWSSIRFDGKFRTQFPLPVPTVTEEPSSVHVSFPDQVSFGYAWQPTDRLLLEVDLFWTEWSEFETLTFRQPSGPIAEAFDWKDTWKVGTGFTYELDDSWKLSGGYWYSEEVGPDMTFNPRLADVALHILSVGVSHQGESWKSSLTYQLGIGEDRTITTSPPLTPSGATANGTYSYLANGFVVSLARPF